MNLPLPSRVRKLGPVLWALAAQFFVAEQLVSLAWPFPYSRTRYYISDLGSVNCAALTDGAAVAVPPVCSPLHAYMNASFILLGLLIAVGALMTRSHFPAGRLVTAAMVSIFSAGLGAIVVGLVPNDVMLPLHLVGALLFLFGASIGMLLLAGSRQVRDRFRLGAVLFTLLSGAVVLVATAFFASGVTLGLGIGGMERAALYPIPLWITLAGVYLSARRPDEAA